MVECVFHGRRDSPHPVFSGDGPCRAVHWWSEVLRSKRFDVGLRRRHWPTDLRNPTDSAAHRDLQLGLSINGVYSLAGELAMDMDYSLSTCRLLLLLVSSSFSPGQFHLGYPYRPPPERGVESGGCAAAVLASGTVQ